MHKLAFGAIMAAIILLAAPVIARDYPQAPPAVQDDSNSYWLDYQTDLSETKRELRSDLRRAKTEQDRREAWAEYRREIADARHDYSKQMREKGFTTASVRVLDDNE